MEIAELHTIFLSSSGVSTDTRNITQNCIFFALKGDNFNGNSYATEAINKGAHYAVIDEEAYHNNKNTILVNNALETLQQLANYHRNQCSAKIISLTGSNGKTTTKELIKSVLETTYNTIATQGNLNNHIGVPLTLLNIKENTEIAIVEMGANHLKEIALLCSIAEPDYGYITNFGKAHLEGFGGVEGVIKGKSELYDYLKSHNKFIFYNQDDSIQVEKTNNYNSKHSFSLHNNEKTNIYITQNTHSEYISITIDNTSIQSNLIGHYNLPNIAIAATIGNYFNIPTAKIKEGIENYTPNNNRSQIIEKNSNKIILDAYNANPSSMTAALDNLNKLESTQKIAILGDMFELGATSGAEHQHIVDKAAELSIQIITLGNHFYHTNNNTNKFTEFENLQKHIETLQLKNHTILIKGSRGMKMVRILEIL